MIKRLLIIIIWLTIEIHKHKANKKLHKELLSKIIFTCILSMNIKWIHQMSLLLPQSLAGLDRAVAFKNIWNLNFKINIYMSWTMEQTTPASWLLFLCKNKMEPQGDELKLCSSFVTVYCNVFMYCFMWLSRYVVKFLTNR